MILFDQNLVQALFFLRVKEAMILYHSILTLESSVGVRKRKRRGGRDSKSGQRGQASMGAAVPTATDLFQRLLYWGEWQLLIKTVAD